MNPHDLPADGVGEGADRRETIPPRQDSGRRHNHLVDIPARAIRDEGGEPLLVLWGVISGALTVVVLVALYVWATYWSNS